MLFALVCVNIVMMLSGCTEESPSAENLRSVYRDMTGCVMEASVFCSPDEIPWRAELRCEYIPDGVCTVEVLSPETIEGVRVTLDGDNWYLRYEGKNLNAGTVSPEQISPAACLPRMMDALRNGWLIEENAETWENIPCLRLTVDQSGMSAGKIYTTLWLRTDDATPLRGEIAVDEQTVLTAEFTSFHLSTTETAG